MKIGWMIYTMTIVYMWWGDAVKWVRRFKVPAKANHSNLMEAYSQTLCKGWTVQRQLADAVVLKLIRLTYVLLISECPMQSLDVVVSRRWDLVHGKKRVVERPKRVKLLSFEAVHCRLSNAKFPRCSKSVWYLRRTFRFCRLVFFFFL